MSNRGENTVTQHETAQPIVVHPEHLKGGTPVVCRTEQEARIVEGMDQFGAWLRGEVLA